MTTAKNEAGNADGGPQMDHPEVVAANIAHGVGADVDNGEPKKKAAAKSGD